MEQLAIHLKTKQLARSMNGYAERSAFTKKDGTKHYSSTENCASS